MTSSRKILLRLTLIGLSAGLLGSYVTSVRSSLFGNADVIWANWRPLGMPPGKPTKFLGFKISLGMVGNDQKLADCWPDYGACYSNVVVGNDENAYSCCWSQVAPGDYEADSLPHDGAYILNYPPNAVDSSTYLSCFIISCSSEQDYVIRADGTVWTCCYGAWNEVSYSHYAWLIGALMGLIFGTLATRFNSLSRRFWITAAVCEAAVILGAPFLLTALVPVNRPQAAGKILIRPGVLVSNVTFSPDGRQLAGSAGDHVRIWDAKTGIQLHTMSVITTSRYVAFSPDGRLLASASDNKVAVLNATTGSVLHILRGHTQRVWRAAFSPDGRLLASGDLDGSIRLWDPESGTALRVLTGHTGWENGLAFSPDGSLLASAGSDGTVRLWDPATGNQLSLLKGHDQGVNAVAFSPDGHLLATGGTDRTVRIWDVATRKMLRVLSGHTNPVLSVAFSPDGRLVASGGDDRTVRLWDVETGNSVGQPMVLTNTVLSVAFSPDGSMLASALGDWTVALWKMP